MSLSQVKQVPLTKVCIHGNYNLPTATLATLFLSLTTGEIWHVLKTLTHPCQDTHVVKNEFSVQSPWGPEPSNNQARSLNTNPLAPVNISWEQLPYQHFIGWYRDAQLTCSCVLNPRNYKIVTVCCQRCRIWECVGMQQLGVKAPCRLSAWTVNLIPVFDHFQNLNPRCNSCYCDRHARTRPWILKTILKELSQRICQQQGWLC